VAAKAAARAPLQNYPREVIAVGDAEPQAAAPVAEAAPVRIGGGGLTVLLQFEEAAPRGRGPQGLRAVVVTDADAQGIAERRPPNVIQFHEDADQPGAQPRATDAGSRTRTATED
jgi:hypothetical protein